MALTPLQEALYTTLGASVIAAALFPLALIALKEWRYQRAKWRARRRQH